MHLITRYACLIVFFTFSSIVPLPRGVAWFLGPNASAPSGFTFSSAPVITAASSTNSPGVHIQLHVNVAPQQVATHINQAFTNPNIRNDLQAFAFDTNHTKQEIALYGTYTAEHWLVAMQQTSSAQAFQSFGLYRYDGYRAMLQNLPTYRPTMITLYKKMYINHKFRRELDTLGHGIREYIETNGRKAWLEDQQSYANHAYKNSNQIKPILDHFVRQQNEIQSLIDFSKQQEISGASLADAQALQQFNATMAKTLQQAQELSNKTEITEKNYQSHAKGIYPLHGDAIIRAQFGFDAFNIMGNAAQHHVHKTLLVEGAFRHYIKLTMDKNLSKAQQDIIRPILADVKGHLAYTLQCNQRGNITELQQHLGLAAAKMQYAETIRTGVRSCDIHHEAYLTPYINDLINHNATSIPRIQADFFHSSCKQACQQQCAQSIQHTNTRSTIDKIIRNKDLIHAMQEVCKGNGTISVEQYHLSPAARTWLEQHNIPTAFFEHKIGNPVEQALHKQAVDLINRATGNQLKSVIASSQGSLAALQANNIPLATACTDLGHTLIDCHSVFTIMDTMMAQTYKDQLQGWQEFKTAFISHLEHTIDGIAYVARNPSVVLAIPEQAAVLLVDHMGIQLTGSNADRALWYTKKYEANLAHLKAIYQGCDQLIADIKQMTTPEIAGHVAGILVETAAMDGLLKVASQTAHAAKLVAVQGTVKTASKVSAAIAESSQALKRAIGNARIVLLKESPEVVIADLGLKSPADLLAMEAEQIVGGKTANSMEMSHRKVKNSLTREQIIDKYKGVQHGKREILLPKMESYEQARNRGLEILKDVDWASGKPFTGNIGVGKGKITGREWYDGKVTLRLDWDPNKGPHLNVTDFRNAKGSQGIAVAIPFEGTEETVLNLLKHLQ